jgi:hypothetical protein
MKMRKVTVFFRNGDQFDTLINGTDQEILSHYVGKRFNLGDDFKEVLTECFHVDFHDKPFNERLLSAMQHADAETRKIVKELIIEDPDTH